MYHTSCFLSHEYAFSCRHVQDQLDGPPACWYSSVKTLFVHTKVARKPEASTFALLELEAKTGRPNACPRCNKCEQWKPRLPVIRSHFGSSQPTSPCVLGAVPADIASEHLLLVWHSQLVHQQSRHAICPQTC